MKPFFISLVSLACILQIATISFAQNCNEHKLSSIELSTIKDYVKAFRYYTSGQDSLTIDVKKFGPGPDMRSYTDEGIHIGEANGAIDYCDISITFSKPVYYVSFVLSHFNNNEGNGNEEVQNFNIYAQSTQNITNTAKFEWITGPQSGYMASKTGSTVFNDKIRTIAALPGACCAYSSGRISIKSPAPFNKLTFRHQDIGEKLLANGVVICGDLIYCVALPTPLAVNDSVTGPYNQPLSIEVLGNDSTYGGTSINKASIDLDPATDGIQDSKTTSAGFFYTDRFGQVNFEPGKDFSGEARVNYTFRNSKNATSTTGSITFKLQKPLFTEKISNTIVYFDVDKSTIRADAAKELDKLIVLYKKYPGLKFELSSYTDCRGSNTYNANLSELRAQSSANYLISKGIPSEIIIRKGLGEATSQSCNCETKESSCPDKSYQSNRRTEIKIIVPGDNK